MLRSFVHMNNGRSEESLFSGDDEGDGGEAGPDPAVVASWLADVEQAATAAATGAAAGAVK
jgi:hypothetical protein